MILSVVLSMSVLSCANVFAKETPPSIILKNKDLNVPNAIIQEIIKENHDAGQITIIEYKENDSLPNQTIIMSPQATSTYTDIKKTVTTYKALAKDLFVTSAARGQTTTLSQTWSGTLSSSITGELPKSQLSLAGSITKTYSASSTFSGPPESSRYNTREFRVKYYQNIGTYTAIEHSGLSGSAGTMTRKISGNWTEPVSYLAYSIDKIV